MANNFEDGFYNSVDTTMAPGQLSQDQTLSEAERLRQEEQWRDELARLEDEIETLKSVLNSKVNESTELKRKLGITAIVELKQEIKQNWQAIRESETVQKTNEKLSQISENIAASNAYQKTNEAFKSFGAFASRKMGDLKNSNAFRSMEDKVGGAYGTIKSTLTPSQSEQNMSGGMTYGRTEGLLDEKDEELFSSTGGKGGGRH